MRSDTEKHEYVCENEECKHKISWKWNTQKKEGDNPHKYLKLIKEMRARYKGAFSDKIFEKGFLSALQELELLILERNEKQ